MTFSTRAYARITLELTGPCCISTGDDSFDSDLPFVTDANGLPMLPGTSIAGMLRAACLEHLRDFDDREWFGYQERDRGAASRVWVSNAHIHDEKNKPVDGQHRSDFGSFLETLAIGEVRDHVRIDHLGVADTENRGKFDQQVLLAGTRFTFDLELVGHDGDEEELSTMLEALVDVLGLPTVRLGGRVHSGLGGFIVQYIEGRLFNLSVASDYDAYCALPVSLATPANLDRLPTPGRSMHGSVGTYTIEITPETFFYIGAGEALEDGPRAPQIATVRGRRVIWSHGFNTISDPIPYIPATSIKGAISHRFCFHYNRLTGAFADASPLTGVVGESNAGVRELFGYCNDEDHNGDSGARASGRVIFEDIWLDSYARKEHTRKLMHTSLDHFTQGVRGNMLFAEEVLAPGDALSLTIHIERPEELSEATRRALDLSIRDLCTGRLALGGGYGRGHGHFRGSYQSEGIELAPAGAQHEGAAE